MSLDSKINQEAYYFEPNKPESPNTKIKISRILKFLGRAVSNLFDKIIEYQDDPELNQAEPNQAELGTR